MLFSLLVTLTKHFVASCFWKDAISNQTTTYLLSILVCKHYDNLDVYQMYISASLWMNMMYSTYLYLVVDEDDVFYLLVPRYWWRWCDLFTCTSLLMQMMYSIYLYLVIDEDDVLYLLVPRYWWRWCILFTCTSLLMKIMYSVYLILINNLPIYSKQI